MIHAYPTSWSNCTGNRRVKTCYYHSAVHVGTTFIYFGFFSFFFWTDHTLALSRSNLPASNYHPLRHSFARSSQLYTLKLIPYRTVQSPLQKLFVQAVYQYKRTLMRAFERCHVGPWRLKVWNRFPLKNFNKKWSILEFAAAKRNIYFPFCCSFLSPWARVSNGRSCHGGDTVNFPRRKFLLRKFTSFLLAPKSGTADFYNEWIVIRCPASEPAAYTKDASATSLVK